MKQAERNVAFSGSPVMYSQFSVQHMWRISTHLHTEAMSDQVSDGKMETQGEAPVGDLQIKTKAKS